MHYALHFRTFIFSHYFYRGLRTAIGVIGLTLLIYYLVDLPTAMTVCIGALCTSFMDLPSPLRHKFNEMLASAVLCSLITLIISLSAPHIWLLNGMLIAISFLTSMMVAFGNKTTPLQFAALLIMTLSIQNVFTAHEALLHTGLVLWGGLAYLAYAMSISWFLRKRLKQQVLAEALFELARYINIKSDFYDIKFNLNDQFNALIRQQIQLAETQQASRDLILRANKKEFDAVLVQLHFSMMDLYERILSTHVDYTLLRHNFGGQDVLIYIRDLVKKAAIDVESIAYDLTRKRYSSISDISYKAEQQAIESTITKLENDALAGRISEEALTVLQISWTKISSLLNMIAELRLAMQPNTNTTLPVLTKADITSFLTQQKYELQILLSHLTWKSPVFRFSVRIALAVTVGLIVAKFMPYVAHSYWILLTIFVVLKPSFSMTKQRRADRLTGTLIGCVLTAIILHFFKIPIVLIGFLFLATIAAKTFFVIRYRYTAIAATVQILLQINLLAPSGGEIILERLFDTLIGAAIATVFSFILPSWEYRDMSRLMASVLKSSKLYILSSKDLLEEKVKNDFLYRLNRKRFMESLAGLSSALVRMLDEPQDKQRAISDINQFIVQNYLVVARITAVRLLFRNHAKGLPADEVHAYLKTVWENLCIKLTLAQKNFEEVTQEDCSIINSKEIENVQEPSSSQWTGWKRLHSRANQLNMDVQEIAERSINISNALRD